jgi:glutamate-1-semialdehyde 2,1-aminomutase
MRGAQYVHHLTPDLCTFAKGMANGFPVAALAGRRDVMRLGGFVEDHDRVFLLSQTYGAQPWAMAAVLATIDSYEHEGVTEHLYRMGARLRAGFERAVNTEGLAEFLQVEGRDCNLVFVTRDADGKRSQVLRTVLLQELMARGILSPSFVVSFAHDEAAIDTTIDAIASALPLYRRALDCGAESVLHGRPVRPAIRRRG